MKTRQITIKQFANSSPKCEHTLFQKEFFRIEGDLKSEGYKELNTAFDTLRGKNATEKIIIKAKYWAGNWSDITTRIFTIFYK
jgi:hypothetical protein